MLSWVYLEKFGWTLCSSLKWQKHVFWTCPSHLLKKQQHQITLGPIIMANKLLKTFVQFWLPKIKIHREPSHPFPIYQQIGHRCRCCLLIYACVAMGGTFALEQPSSSTWAWLPRVRELFRNLKEVGVQSKTNNGFNQMIFLSYQTNVLLTMHIIYIIESYADLYVCCHVCM